MSNLRLEKVHDQRGFGLVACLRTLVYVIEQNCPPCDEFDERDNNAENYLAWAGDEPVASCRILYDGGIAKIGRIVTVKEHRGKGYASQMLQQVMGDLRNNAAIKTIKMSAQTHAIGLYEKLGFSAYGEEYIEDNIPHRMMKFDVNQEAAA